MDGWFDGWAAGGVATAVGWTIAALLLLVAVLAGLRLMRGQPLPFAMGPRAPKHRIAVVDSTVIDRQHRLILIRRDNVEHLVLIGGSRDLLIESDIPVHDHEGERERPRRAPEREVRPPARGIPVNRNPVPQPPRRDQPARRPVEIAAGEPAPAPTAPVPAAPVAAAALAATQAPAIAETLAAAPPIERPQAAPEAIETGPAPHLPVEHDRPALGGEVEPAPIMDEPPLIAEPIEIAIAAADLPEPSLDLPDELAPRVEHATAATQEPAEPEPADPSAFWPLRFEPPFTGAAAGEASHEGSNGTHRPPAHVLDAGDGDVDDALLQELEMTLDRDRSRSETGTSVSRETTRSLNEEMDRLLGELSGDRR